MAAGQSDNRDALKVYLDTICSSLDSGFGTTMDCEMNRSTIAQAKEMNSEDSQIVTAMPPDTPKSLWIKHNDRLVNVATQDCDLVTPLKLKIVSTKNYFAIRIHVSARSSQSATEPKRARV